MANEEKPKKKGFFREFKEFLARGNVLDLAVAVIIGAAFGAIVTSLVNDIIMPLIAYAGGVNSIGDLAVELRPATVVVVEGVEVVKEALLWRYGNFLQAIINFIIIAFVVFCFVKLVMKMKQVSEKVAENAKKAKNAEAENSENPEKKE